MAGALVNKLKEGKIYFPNYITESTSGWDQMDLSKDRYKITFGTLVRIQAKNGKWYIAHVLKEFVVGQLTERELFAYINFINDAYRLLICGVIPDNIEDLKLDGYPFFELDELQISEQERMKNI